MTHTARTQRSEDCLNTAATHRGVGNTFMADKMQAKGELYAAMTDEQYASHVESERNPAQTRAAARMAAELMARLG